MIHCLRCLASKVWRGLPSWILASSMAQRLLALLGWSAGSWMELSGDGWHDVHESSQMNDAKSKYLRYLRRTISIDADIDDIDLQLPTLFWSIKRSTCPAHTKSGPWSCNYMDRPMDPICWPFVVVVIFYRRLKTAEAFPNNSFLKFMNVFLNIHVTLPNKNIHDPFGPSRAAMAIWAKL